MLGFARLNIMADDNKMNGDEKNLRKPGGGRMQPSTIAVWIAIIGGMALLFAAFECRHEPGAKSSMP